MRSFKSWLLFLGAVAGFGSLPAQAQHTFRPYAGFALTSYSIKFDNNGFVGYQNKTAKSDYLAPTVGFTWVLPQRVFFDAQYQSSPSSATHDLWKDVTPTPADQDFSRKTFNLTGGYVHVFPSGNSISGFGGYTQGDSKLAAPRGATIPNSGGATIGWSEDRFKSRGVFLGVGGGFPGLGGLFSVSGAIALMKGTWTDDTGFSADAAATVGASLSGGYTYRITPALGITGDLRLQNYSYTFEPSGFLNYTVKENTRALGVRVSYQF